MLQAGPNDVNPGSRESAGDIPDYSFQGMTFKTQKYTVCLRFPDGAGRDNWRARAILATLRVYGKTCGTCNKRVEPGPL